MFTKKKKRRHPEITQLNVATRKEEFPLREKEETQFDPHGLHLRGGKKKPPIHYTPCDGKENCSIINNIKKEGHHREK